MILVGSYGDLYIFYVAYKGALFFNDVLVFYFTVDFIMVFFL